MRSNMELLLHYWLVLEVIVYNKNLIYLRGYLHVLNAYEHAFVRAHVVPYTFYEAIL